MDAAASRSLIKLEIDSVRWGFPVGQRFPGIPATVSDPNLIADLYPAHASTEYHQ
jgi:hypothetical protein